MWQKIADWIAGKVEEIVKGIKGLEEKP